MLAKANLPREETFGSCCPFGWPIRTIEQLGRAALAAHRNQSRFVRLGSTQPPWFCNRLMRSFFDPSRPPRVPRARNRTLAECERPVSDRGHTPAVWEMPG